MGERTDTIALNRTDRKFGTLILFYAMHMVLALRTLASGHALG